MGDVVAAASEVMLVDPLNDVADIQQAVDSPAFNDTDTNPMVALMTMMTRKIYSLSLQQATSKKQNALLMASARKSRIDDTLAKLANPMRAVKLNYRLFLMVKDLPSVFKPDGLALVPTNLDDMKDLSATAVLVLEEIVRLLRRDLEVHRVANLLPFLDS